MIRQSLFIEIIEINIFLCVLCALCGESACPLLTNLKNFTMMEKTRGGEKP